MSVEMGNLSAHHIFQPCLNVIDDHAYDGQISLVPNIEPLGENIINNCCGPIQGILLPRSLSSPNVAWRSDL